MTDSGGIPVYVTYGAYMGYGREERYTKGVSLSKYAAIVRLREFLRNRYLVPIVDTDYDVMDLIMRQHQQEYQREEIWFSEDGTYAVYGATRWLIEEVVTDKELL